ncbi:hypothetical protein BN6_63560 [Saccharothrix espanaensis DSM 44229]|uniref:Uncharacterized protein n=1 Tax=Saccharothrix espanaensis (strain ATCC 51144 / DSM 44229 / JCM 9112 / NBRC 15066 / NRRL 15764) TaxID=1179773 RepID=K0K059_SACES|nr:hypothetical protein BN6_63560 [Saccharothrix espanaensis DSM 44229]
MPGVTPVALGSPERTAADLLAVLRRIKGTRDPGLEVSATQAAELAHRPGCGLLAVVEHPGADPALLMAGVVPVDRPVDPDLGVRLDGPAIRDVTRGVTATGCPVVIVERIPVTGTGAQLQVVVTDPAHPRVAVFTLHSPTGRGWLDVAGLAGRFVSGIEFDDPGLTGRGTRSASGRPPGGTSGRSARR